jgi:hypothetical protein
MIKRTAQEAVLVLKPVPTQANARARRSRAMDERRSTPGRRIFCDVDSAL